MGRDSQARGAEQAAGDTSADPPTDGPRGANWVAAYAMGLASARRRIETCLQELVAAAGGRPEPLAEAAARLHQLDGFDERLRGQAHRLLTACLDHIEGQPTAGTVAGRTPTDARTPRPQAPAPSEGTG